MDFDSNSYRKLNLAGRHTVIQSSWGWRDWKESPHTLMNTISNVNSNGQHCWIWYLIQIWNYCNRSTKVASCTEKLVIAKFNSFILTFYMAICNFKKTMNSMHIKILLWPSVVSKYKLSTRKLLYPNISTVNWYTYNSFASKRSPCESYWWQ